MHKAMTIAALAAAVAATAVGTGGCAPLVVAGAVAGGALVVNDRRSPGIQLEDEAIERRINRALVAKFEQGSLNVAVTSYNRKVLLTGQIATEEQRAEAERLAAGAENVRSVLNEIVVGPLSTVGSRSSDTAVSAKVRAALLNEKYVPSASIKVVTDGGKVYLLGRVTEPEGELAARTASRVSGVQQVVKAFDYLTEQEAAALKAPTPAQTRAETRAETQADAQAEAPRRQ